MGGREQTDWLFFSSGSQICLNPEQLRSQANWADLDRHIISSHAFLKKIFFFHEKGGKRQKQRWEHCSVRHIQCWGSNLGILPALQVLQFSTCWTTSMVSSQAHFRNLPFSLLTSSFHVFLFFPSYFLENYCVPYTHGYSFSTNTNLFYFFVICVLMSFFPFFPSFFFSFLFFFLSLYFFLSFRAVLSSGCWWCWRMKPEAETFQMHILHCLLSPYSLYWGLLT